MSSTDTLGQLHRVCTRRRSLTGGGGGSAQNFILTALFIVKYQLEYFDTDFLLSGHIHHTHS